MSLFKSFTSKAVPIPITQSMLHTLLTFKKPEALEALDIRIDEDALTIQGKVKKGVRLPFYLKLQPIDADKRKLYFKVKKMKPLDFTLVKQLVLNHIPTLSYHKELLTLNLNEIDTVKKIPLGNIKTFSIKDDKLWVYLGL